MGQPEDKAAYTAERVKFSELNSVVDNPSRHPRQTGKVLREERQVEADRGPPKRKSCQGARCTYDPSTSATNKTLRHTGQTELPESARSGSVQRRSKYHGIANLPAPLQRMTPVTLRRKT